MDLNLIDKTPNGMTRYHMDLVRSVLNYAGEYLKLAEDTEMSVTFMDNKQIHEYNREYRNIDKPTDVISFALEDEADDFPILDDELFEDLPKNIGDILVSVEKVTEQAEYLGHSWERELGFLVVHGFLHLNGYDHMLSEEDEKEMFDLQREILDTYGLRR